MEFSVSDSQVIGQIIGSINVGMLTTVQGDGQLRSRPMLCAHFDFDTLWFLIKEARPIIADLMHNRVVNVAFSNPEKKLYASVTGVAQLVEDGKLVQKLWRSEMISWFPRGLQEPDLALLRVDIQHAEAWNSESTT
jgi:general stress protein 26